MHGWTERQRQYPLTIIMGRKKNHTLQGNMDQPKISRKFSWNDLSDIMANDWCYFSISSSLIIVLELSSLPRFKYFWYHHPRDDTIISYHQEWATTLWYLHYKYYCFLRNNHLYLCYCFILVIFLYHQLFHVYILISPLVLTLKAPNKHCSRQHFIFLLLSF